MTLNDEFPDDTVTGAHDTRVVPLQETMQVAPPGGFSGPEAAELAGISYRQLDYWARRRWVAPSTTVNAGVHRRVYSVGDIVRLAALGHLGRSRVDVATYAEATGRLCVPDHITFLIVWAIHDESVRLVSAKDLGRVTSRPGRYVVFDPGPLLRTVGRRSADTGDARPRRRTFSNDYKLRVLAEYESLTAPGAKGAMLRREGLHTSHLVAWRRNRDAGELRASIRPPRRGPPAAGRPGVAAIKKRRVGFERPVTAPASLHQPA